MTAATTVMAAMAAKAATAATAVTVGRAAMAGRVEMCVTKKIIIISVTKVLYNTILCHIALMCMVLIGM